MNRAILILILSGSSILVSQLCFFFLPISIFPCTIAALDRGSIQTLCSVAEVTNSKMFVTAHFTGYGEFVYFMATWAVPIAWSIAIVLATSKRSRSRKRSVEQLP